MRLGLLIVPVLLLACGDDDSTPADARPAVDAPIDARSAGSGNLLVAGTFVVENASNGTSGTGLRVNCEVRVSRDGAPVENAIVTVNPAPPAYQVVLPGEAGDLSHYTGFYTGFFATARISVSVAYETDFVGEVTLSGPQVYQIFQPTADVPTGADMHVTWDLPGGAVDGASVELLSGFLATGLPDDGSYDVPMASLTPGADEVIVTRWRDNPLGVGAAVGSHILFGNRAHKDINVVAP
jgi:hypothetical protein